MLAVSAAAERPYAVVFSFNDAAIYGPVDGHATLYPIPELKPPDSVVEPVEVVIDDDPIPEGYWLRLVYDDRKLPPAARPGHVRVLLNTKGDEWREVPARLLVNFDAKRPTHRALYVAITESGVYAVAFGTRHPPPPVHDVLVREIERHRRVALAAPGTDRSRDEAVLAVTRAAASAFRAKLSTLRVSAAARGGKLVAMFDGLLAFFGRAPSKPSTVAWSANAIVLLDPDLAASKLATLRQPLLRALWHASQARRRGVAYTREWVDRLLSVGHADHPLERRAERKAHAVPSQ